MGMPPSRFREDPIERVRFDTTDTVVIDTTSVTYSLGDLNGAEVMQVGAFLQLGDFRSLTSEERISAIVAKVSGAPMPVPAPTPSKATEREAERDATADRNNATATARAGGIGAAIEDLLSSVLDEDKVREIALEAARSAIDFDQLVKMIDDAIKALRPVIVKVEGRPDVKVEGRPHAALTDVVDLLAAGENVWLVGPMGTGKSFLARQAGEALGRASFAQSFGAQSSKGDLFGYVLPGTGELVRTAFRDAWEHGGLFLADEIDAANPQILVMLNDAAASTPGTMLRFPDGDVPRHEDFAMIGAANTWGTGPTAEFVGRLPIDAATTDRFFAIEVDYDRDLETALVTALLGDKAAGWLATAWLMRENAQSNAIRCAVSTRGIVSAAKMIARGWSVKKVTDTRILKSLSSDQRSKVLTGVRL